MCGFILVDVNESSFFYKFFFLGPSVKCRICFFNFGYVVMVMLCFNRHVFFFSIFPERGASVFLLGKIIPSSLHERGRTCFQWCAA